MATSHTSAHPLTPGEVRYKEIRKVTLIGSAVDLSLGVAKLFGGIIAHSQALIADGQYAEVFK